MQCSILGHERNNWICFHISLKRLKCTLSKCLYLAIHDFEFKYKDKYLRLRPLQKQGHGLEELDEELLGELPQLPPPLPAQPGQVELAEPQGRRLDPRRPGTGVWTKGDRRKLPEQVAGHEELHHGTLVEELHHLLLGELLQLLYLVLLAEFQEGDHLLLQDALLNLLQVNVPSNNVKIKHNP